MGKKNENLVYTKILLIPYRTSVDLPVLVSPVEQSMVQVFTEALKDPVVVSDRWSFILAGRKVTLQLQ